MAANTAPRARDASARMREQLMALRENEQFTERMQTPATESMFYDKSAPSTIDRRARARANYKLFCEVFYDETDEADMYAADKLIDRVCRFIEGMVKTSKGKLAEKVKVSTLMQYRQSLEWWIRLFTPNFSTMQVLFQARVSHHTHMVAVTQDLSTELREKNNLGEFEIELFFNQIMLENTRIDNWKQHYTAWVLAFITGARPGSFTVSPRYRKGTPMGGAVSDSMPTRAESHTLRWSDVQFERMKDGIACSVTFRFMKGHQDPHRGQYVMGKREWFFPPKNTRLHLDVSMLMFLLAFERGLFVETLDELLKGTQRFIKKDKTVDQQAVFVSADANGTLIPSRDMGYGALNPKLQEMCLSVGLLGYNNMYAFRREAATVTKHTAGLEGAQELLNHVPGNKLSYIHYDPKGFGRRDTTAFRLGGPELSAADVRKYFSQATLAWQPEDTTKTAREEIKARVEERLLDDEEWFALDDTLESILQECHQTLQALGHIAADDNYGYAARNVAKYTAYMNEDGIKTQPGIAELLKKLQTHHARRKTRRRDIRTALTTEVTKILKADATDRQPIYDLAEAAVGATGDEDDNEDDDEIDNAASAGRNEEPETWKAAEEGQVFVAPDEVGDDDLDGDTRVAFIQKWLDKTDSVVKSSGLVCFRCQADPTLPKEAKDKKWVLGKYNTHLKSQVHSRREQLRRAFMIMLEDADNVACPLCSGRLYTRVKGFMAHLDNVHQDQLWLEEGADNVEDVEDVEQAVEDDDGNQEQAGDEESDEMLYDM